MRIDITLIDKLHIDKKEQFHHNDETAPARCLSVVFQALDTDVDVSRSHTSYCLFHKFSSCIAKRGYEILIELCELVSFMVYKNVLIHLFVSFANALNEVVSVKYLL